METLPFERLTRPVFTRVSLDQLVLPEEVRATLMELPFQWAAREAVRQMFGFEGTIRGSGFLVLMEGEKGHGKTTCAASVCGQIGIPLQSVRLPSLISSYMGETVKHLDVVLEGAQQAGCALLFDEVDAIASARGHGGGGGIADITHKQCVAFLLQAMDTFDGLVFATTNLGVDPAFRDRAHAVLRFTELSLEERVEVWRRALAKVPREEFDLTPFGRYPLSPRMIVRCAFRSALNAAAQGGILEEEQLLRVVDATCAALGHVTRR